MPEEHKRYAKALIIYSLRVYSQEAVDALHKLGDRGGVTEQRFNQITPTRTKENTPCWDITMQWRFEAHQGWSAKNDAHQRVGGVLKKLQRTDVEVLVPEREFIDVCPCHS